MSFFNRLPPWCGFRGSSQRGNRLARTTADDSEKEGGMKKKTSVTWKVTMAETTKPLESG
ncbi:MULTISPECIES: hypothetical protein [unclassified Pseudomonas]|uniref:hypothetical protein n=1 Tax=unclassified Pseudomonas TaxID=196821 RepID=UPI0011B5CCCF|nr:MULTISPECIES: hypothetical protein [unclassified Pseudomonas]